MKIKFNCIEMELSKTKSSVYASLCSTKMRRKHGLFVVEGMKSVADTIGHFQLECLITVKDSGISMGVDRSIVYEVTEPEMKRLSGLSTVSEVMAVFHIPERQSPGPKLPRDLYLALDGIQDPGNLGTIIRTCHWFGIKHIFASRDTADLYNPKCVQSTMGSIAKVDVTYCDLGELFNLNRELPVFGLLLDGKDIFKSELADNGFIVMGNEGKGISSGVRRFITDPLLIPPTTDDHAESLNVAVATAIALARFRGR